MQFHEFIFLIDRFRDKRFGIKGGSKNCQGISSTVSIVRQKKYKSNSATMKFLTVFAVLCLVAYSTQSPLFEGCEEEVQKYFDENSCMIVKCFSFKNETVNVSEMTANSCPFPKCEEGQEFKGQNAGDKAAVYPDCCATPICE